MDQLAKVLFVCPSLAIGCVGDDSLAKLSCLECEWRDLWYLLVKLNADIELNTAHFSLKWIMRLCKSCERPEKARHHLHKILRIQCERQLEWMAEFWLCNLVFEFWKILLYPSIYPSERRENRSDSFFIVRLSERRNAHNYNDEYLCEHLLSSFSQRISIVACQLHRTTT